MIVGKSIDRFKSMRDLDSISVSSFQFTGAHIVTAMIPIALCRTFVEGVFGAIGGVESPWVAYIVGVMVAAFGIHPFRP